MKKKITAIFLCVALVAIAVVGASLAYFTDTDSATNTFTAGGVKIKLIEEQSNEDHTGFVPYEGDKVLMPIVGSAQGEKYPNGQPKAANYIGITSEATSANIQKAIDKGAILVSGDGTMTVNVLVQADAIQAEGFADAKAAFAAFDAQK